MIKNFISKAIAYRGSTVSRFKKNERGAIIIEFALLVPIVIILMLVSIDTLRFIHMDYKVSETIDSLGKGIQYKPAKPTQNLISSGFRSMISKKGIPYSMLPYSPDTTSGRYPLTANVRVYAKRKNNNNGDLIQNEAIDLGLGATGCTAENPKAIMPLQEDGSVVVSICIAAQFETIFGSILPIFGDAIKSLDNAIIVHQRFYEAYRFNVTI